MKNIKISVIIPTYNRKELLLYTLESLVQQTMSNKEYEVIICDDGSVDDTYKVVQKYYQKINIKYYYHNHDGYRVALTRNAGIRIASGDICVFLDSSMVADKKFLENHLLEHEKGNKDIVVGYIYGFDIEKKQEERLEKLFDIYDLEKSFNNICISEFRDKREYTMEQIGYNMSEWEAPWVYFWTGNVSVKRSELIKVGMFDEDYVMWGGEDTDLGIRLYIQGLQYAFSKEAKAIHYPHPSADTKDNNKGERALQRKKDLYQRYGLKSMELWLEVESKELNVLLHKSKKVNKIG